MPDPSSGAARGPGSRAGIESVEHVDVRTCNVPVLVCYAELRQETREALETDGYRPRYVDVSASQFAYHEALSAEWRQGRGFINVEHDIVPWPGALRELWDCSEPWCVFTYRVNAEYDGYLGCVRFSDALVRNEPDAMDAAGRLTYGPPPRYWGWVDNRLGQVLTDRGYRKHRHWPAVTHLRTYPQAVAWNCRCGAAIPEEIVASGPPPHLCPACEAT